MALQLKKAQRSQAPMRVGIAAPSGGGKTAGALLVAYGLMKTKYPQLSEDKIWEKVAIIDTEHGSGELYVGSEIANTKIGVYGAVTLTSPFEVSKYIEAIDLCEKEGIEVCIIDSLTHAWSGEGGLLEQQNNAAKRSGNSWTAWRDITPQHSKLVEAMLQSPMHIIATMRSKTEYAQEKDEGTGKTVVKKLGMEPEVRKGMEYEFTIFLDVDISHVAYGSKDRTSLFDKKYFTLSPKTGEAMMKWLESGVTSEPVVVATSHPASKENGLQEMKDSVIDLCKALGGRGNDKLMALLGEYTTKGNPNEINDEAKLVELRSRLIELQNSKE